MTQEIPRQHGFEEAQFCDDCNVVVRLERTENRTLRLACACGEFRPIKVCTRLPEGWQE